MIKWLICKVLKVRLREQQADAWEVGTILNIVKDEEVEI